MPRSARLARCPRAPTPDGRRKPLPSRRESSPGRATVPVVNAAVACWACGAAASPESAWLPVELYQCPECGLLFAPDRTAEDLQRLYDAGYFEEYPGGEGYEDDPAQRRYEAARRTELI